MSENHEIEESSYQWKDRTILIAEDIDVNFLFLEKILFITGANIIRSVNGEEAIDTVKSNSSITLVLMDIHMPGIDGFETTRRIKQIRPDLPVIIQTMQDIETDRKLSQECGADAFVQKPVNVNKLLAIINRFIPER